MRKAWIATLIVISQGIGAEVLKDRIHSVEQNLIKFTNGRVAYTNQSNHKLRPNQLVSATLDENSNLVSISLISPPLTSLQDRYSRNEESPTIPSMTPPTFEPSIVPSMEEMENIFNRSNSYYKRVSECSDRAHVWAFDELNYSGTKSRKIFVFFTASYINSVRFKWWFHVAPLYSVATPEGIKEMVADFRYTDRPMTVKEWTDQFVYTKRPCKVTTKFSEYDVNPQTENCYLIYESMHYKIPGEIYQQETLGRYKTDTSEAEVNQSRRWAFEQ